MSYIDDVSRKVKEKADEWDVQGKVERFAAEVDKVAHDAKDKAAEYADDNRERIREGLDKVGSKIDERTEGRYADKLAKAKDSVTKGVDKLAEQRPGGATPPTPGEAASATTDATPGYTTDAYQPEPYRADPIDPAEPIDRPTDAPISRPADTEPTGTGWPQDTPPKS